MYDEKPPMDYTTAELRNFVTFRISRTYAKLNQQAQKTLSDVTCLTLSQWRILSVIAHEKTATAASIAKFTELDKGQISRAIKNLIEYKFVSRQSHESDKRRQVLALTKTGIAEHAHVLGRMRKRQAMLIENLDQGEIETFLHVLNSIEGRAKEDVI